MDNLNFSHTIKSASFNVKVMQFVCYMVHIGYIYVMKLTSDIKYAFF